MTYTFDWALKSYLLTTNQCAPFREGNTLHFSKTKTKKQQQRVMHAINFHFSDQTETL